METGKLICSHRKQITGWCGRELGGEGGRDSQGPWETFGVNGYVQYLDCGDGFNNVHVCQTSPVVCFKNRVCFMLIIPQ